MGRSHRRAKARKKMNPTRIADVIRQVGKETRNVAEKVEDLAVEAAEAVEAVGEAVEKAKTTDTLPEAVELVQEAQEAAAEVADAVEAAEEVVNYAKMRVSALRKLAKKRGIKGYSSMKKKELVAALEA